MSEFTSDYVATAWGETHHYSLADGQLVYRFGGSDVSYSITLQSGGFSLRSRWQTHRYFRIGLIFVAFSIFTLGVIYAKEHTIGHIGAMLYLQFGMLAVGLVLSVRFHHIYRAYLLRTGSGDAILIYRDPANAERADAFISQINTLA